MKFISAFLFLFLSFQSVADTQKFCGPIDTFRIWANGNDTYGIWVEYEENPSLCPGGFYLKHDSNNKDYVMSFLLAEKAQNNRVCIQAVTSSMNGSRCRINYVYNP
ncbi:hypothetical protein [Agaribacterium sp. ZY112]|uniref:hypothetical protein n=1 Tax=Agaribacterium sp. ZY112 TaxID=3233574 RepID=UPI00352647C6